LGLRAGLNAFANLRPAIVPPQVGIAKITAIHQQEDSTGMRIIIIIIIIISSS
jgi:hypothetical protein